MSSKEFADGLWSADGTHAPCPTCSGAGTTKPKEFIAGDKKSEKHFAKAAMDSKTIMGSGYYGPACKNCGGSGKVYE